MATWIEATPRQRLVQYSLPAARKEVAEAPAMIAEFKDQIARMWAQREGRTGYDRKAVHRRTKALIRDLRSYERSVEWSRNLIADYA